MIKDRNFSDQIVPFEIDIEYKDCNFSHSNCKTVFGQKVGHRIFPDNNTPRTFIDCNMVNCEPPPDSTVIHCNTAIVERMVITATDIVEIDGETIIVNDYANRIHGRYIDGQYKYYPVPIDIPKEVV